MNGVTYYDEEVISEFTLALLEDTGYYKPYYYTGGLMRYGKGKGCDFVKNKCVDSGKINPKFENEFFDTFLSDYKFDSSCSSGRQSRTYQFLSEYNDIPSYYRYFSHNEKLGGRPSADYCPVPRGIDNERVNNQYVGSCSLGNGDYGTFILRNYTYTQPLNSTHYSIITTGIYNTSGELQDILGETFSDQSFCYQSTLIKNDINNFNNTIPRAVCYESFCSKRSLTIKINDDYFLCPRAGGKIVINGYKGYFLCADYNLFCSGTVMCNDLFDCVEKKSEAKEESYIYDYNILTSQNLEDAEINLPDNETNYEISDDGICPKNCKQCKINKRCSICRENYALVGSKKNDKIICLLLNELKIGYYKENDIYYKCMDNCDICNDGITCEECSIGFELINNKCIKEGETTYISPISSTIIESDTSSTYISDTYSDISVFRTEIPSSSLPRLSTYISDTYSDTTKFSSEIPNSSTPSESIFSTQISSSEIENTSTNIDSSIIYSSIPNESTFVSPISSTIIESDTSSTYITDTFSDTTSISSEIPSSSLPSVTLLISEILSSEFESDILSTHISDTYSDTTPISSEIPSSSLPSEAILSSQISSSEFESDILSTHISDTISDTTKFSSEIPITTIPSETMFSTQIQSSEIDSDIISTHISDTMSDTTPLSSEIPNSSIPSETILSSQISSSEIESDIISTYISDTYSDTTKISFFSSLPSSYTQEISNSEIESDIISTYISDTNNDTTSLSTETPSTSLPSETILSSEISSSEIESDILSTHISDTYSDTTKLSVSSEIPSSSIPRETILSSQISTTEIESDILSTHISDTYSDTTSSSSEIPSSSLLTESPTTQEFSSSEFESDISSTIISDTYSDTTKESFSSEIPSSSILSESTLNSQITSSEIESDTSSTYILDTV